MAGTSPPAKARFHPEAQGEYLEVIAYLGLHAPSAIESFAADVQEAVRFIEKHPEGWRDLNEARVGLTCAGT